MTPNRLRFLLAAGMAIPLNDPSGWQVLAYRKIAANKVEFSSTGLKISIDKSASPVVYPLTQSTQVFGLRAKGRRTSGLILKSADKQGDKGHDDFVIRVGVVVSGEKRLTRMQSWVAPDWVKKLYALAPAKSGIDRIEFLNVVEAESLIKRQERRHPKSELLIEKFVTRANDNGEFEISHSWPKGISVVAVWLAADGDDTGSTFTVELKSLELVTRAP